MPRKKGSKNKKSGKQTVQNSQDVETLTEVDGGVDGFTFNVKNVTVYPPSVKDDNDKALYNAMLNDNIITENIPSSEFKDVLINPICEPTRLVNSLVTDYKYKNGRIDWQAMFNPEYLVYPNDDTTKEPFLRVDGLLDLADIRGVESKEVKVVPVSEGMIAVTVTMRFLPNKEEPRGKVWSATADATPSNVGDKKFAKYLTTIAETRATGRCIRGALGIRLCTFEEVSTEDSMDKEDTAPIKDTTLAVIKRQMELKGFTEDGLLKVIHEKIAGTKDVSLLTQLTVTQGQRVVAYLNSKQNTETKI